MELARGVRIDRFQGTEKQIRARFPAFVLIAAALAVMVFATVCYGSNEIAKAIFWLLIAGGLSLSAMNIEHARGSASAEIALQEIRELLTEIKALLQRRN